MDPYDLLELSREELEEFEKFELARRYQSNTAMEKAASSSPPTKRKKSSPTLPHVSSSLENLSDLPGHVRSMYRAAVSELSSSNRKGDCESPGCTATNVDLFVTFPYPDDFTLGDPQFICAEHRA
jgi:hypothetical protein